MSGTNAGVDADIALQAGRGAATPPNPLQQIEQFALTKNLLNQNALFPGTKTLQQQAVQSGQTNLMNLNNASAYRALTPLLAGGPITHDSLTTALGSIENNLGLSTHGVLNDLLATAPTGDGPDFDAKARALIASRSQTSPESAVGMVTPHAGTIDTGPAIQPVQIAAPGAPQPGAMTPVGGSFTKGLTPGEAAQPVPGGVDAQGRPITTNLGNFTSAVNGQPSPLGTGRLPTALRNPANAPAATGTAGGIVTGQSPSQTAAQATTGTDSAHAFQEITNQGVQARSQGAILGNMLEEAQNFTTGPQALNNLKTWAVRNGAALGTAFGLNPTSIAANEGFDKLAAQIADAQGAGSDARLAVNQHANPGSQLSPQGADTIIRQLQGNADYLQARSQLAAQYPDKADRAGFESKIGANLDPRAFQFMRMTPPQQSTYLKSLSPQDRSKLLSSGQWAEQNGLFGAPAQ
jgi:hypothetical protein